MIEFISVSNVGTRPRDIIAALREYAANEGGELWEAVNEVENYEPAQAQLDELMWVYHHAAPKGYRFITKAGYNTNYGFELVVTA